MKVKVTVLRPFDGNMMKLVDIDIENISREDLEAYSKSDVVEIALTLAELLANRTPDAIQSDKPIKEMK